MTAMRVIRPLDVLFMRGNRPFGEAGQHGDVIMPPWPSMFAGALRSAIAANVEGGIEALNRKKPAELPEPVRSCLGAETRGRFRLSRVALARQDTDRARPLLPQPEDLSIVEGKTGPAATLLEPMALPAGVETSLALPHLPVVRRAGLDKASSGWWLTPDGLEAYLAGHAPQPDQLIHSRDLWHVDRRLGIARESGTGTAAEGALYTTEGVVLDAHYRFAVAVEGADDCLPERFRLRLGGDGRAADMEPARVAWPEPDYAALARAGRFRLILTAPALFPKGWRLPGQADDGTVTFAGASARVVAAAVPRHDVASGWDIYQGRPKPAQRFVPAGAVYWIADYTGDADQLAGLVHRGVPVTPEAGDAPPDEADGPVRDIADRKAEGFNTVLLAAWPQDRNDSSR